MFRCSDDEEYFKNDERTQTKNKRSTQQSTSKSTGKSANKSSSKSSSKPSNKSLNQRKSVPFADDEDSNSRGSLIDLRDDDEKLDKYERYDKYDDYDKYSDDDPVNPFDEAEEEPVRKPKDANKSVNDGDEEKPKRKNVVRNPRVLLNDEKLKSQDGVIRLPELFKEVKFKGKNHEKDDLNRIMTIYQNWAHRLMPSLQFDDFIEKAEGLCRKAKMRTFLTKIRNGMPLDIRDKQAGEDDNEVINQYDSQDEAFNDAPKLVPKNMEGEYSG